MKCLACLFAAVVALPAAAIVYGGTNFGFLGYPDPDCSEPYKPYQFSSDFARQQFVSEVEDYLACMREYVDNANNDVKRVVEARDQAIDDANSYVDSL